MASFKIDEAVFDKLAEILKKHELSEIEYKDGDAKIRIAVNSQATGMVCAPSMVHQNFAENVNITPESPVAVSAFELHPGAVKSPMVGTCYMAPEPGAQNFINIGDVIQEGQPIMIIEAMKVMNLIKSPRAGKVIHIAVSDAEPVEYDQLLVVIE